MNYQKILEQIQCHYLKTKGKCPRCGDIVDREILEAIGECLPCHHIRQEVEEAQADLWERETEMREARFDEERRYGYRE